MKQVLILKSEDFFEKPKNILNDIFNFIGVERLEIENIKKHNTSKYNSMNPNTYRRLTNYYKPYNSMLYSFLGRDLGWN